MQKDVDRGYSDETHRLILAREGRAAAPFLFDIYVNDLLLCALSG